jgi:hypothetical protein
MSHPMSYYMNEAMFDLPEAGFVDETVTCLTGRSPSGEGVLFMVERRRLPEGMSLPQGVAALVKDVMTQHTGYRVLFQRGVEVAGRPALDVGACWRTEHGAQIYERRVHLTVGETWLVIMGEAPIAEREVCEACVDHVLGSLRLRE